MGLVLVTGRAAFGSFVCGPVQPPQTGLVARGSGGRGHDGGKKAGME